jgi:NitT/TauT family transport system permease protein
MTIDAAAIPSARRLVARDNNAAPAVLAIVAVIIAIWYLAAIPMNAPIAHMQAQNVGASLEGVDLARAAWSLERPVLPAPHQVARELWNTVVLMDPTSRRSLIYHAWVTLSATLLGFAIGALFGVALAASIVRWNALSKSLMPWIVASQTIPILAIAPIIIVVLGSLGYTGLLPKSIISAYLCFFPVAIGMVKGLTSPDVMHLDLMRSYSASAPQTFWKLRLPTAVPFLFASLKIAAAISLTGAIVGELPTGAQAGLGARLLAGSYYGQTLQIWAALFVAAALTASLVGLVGLAERVTLAAMGARRETRA